VLTFTWSWQGDVKKNVHYFDRTINYEGGSDAVQEVAVKPMITFQLSFNSTKAKLDEIEKFYLLHRKSRAFYFTYEDETYTCRFTSDYNSTDTWGYDNTGKIVGSKAVELTMKVMTSSDTYYDPFEHLVFEEDEGLIINCGDSTNLDTVISGGGA
jgi:phage-related protein